MYDSRLGRFLSLDPLHKKLPSISPYSFAVNSPILFIDFGGTHPKVAIILGSKSDFGTHELALKKAGYQVVYASSAREAVQKMGELSTPESPIENLILISHGSPGGLSINRQGLHTDPEIRDLAEAFWAVQRTKEILTSMGLPSDSKDPNYDRFAYIDANFQAKSESEIFWDGSSEAAKANQDIEIDEYKKSTGAMSICDFEAAINNGEVHFSATRSIVLGGCNLAGYFQLDNQEIFSTTLAVETNSTVFASQGYTGPNLNTTERVSNKEKRRDLKGHWIKTNQSGVRKILDNTIDMAKPE